MRIDVERGTRHRTKQEFAYQTLRDAILRCELGPGERLVIDDLARRLQVSTIPVREAIQMLQSEGLVVTVPHTGVTVAPVSPESIQDVFAVLEGLEVVASRIVAERAVPREIESLERLVAEMDRAVAAGRHARWDRVRRYFFRGVLVHRVEQAQQEHRTMIQAMRAGDLQTLEATVRQHNRRAFESYMRFLNSAEPPQGGVSEEDEARAGDAKQSSSRAPRRRRRRSPSARRPARDARLRSAGSR